MSRPLSVKPEYYTLIERCWKKIPHARPSSKLIVSALKKFLFELIDKEKNNVGKNFCVPLRKSYTKCTVDDVD